MRRRVIAAVLGAKKTAGVLATGTAISLTFVSGVGPLSARQADGPARPIASHSSVLHLTGAGSTFDAPFFEAAFARYQQFHPGISITYDAVGSGQGIERFSADTVNFGASDVPMTTAEQVAARGGPVVQVPIDLGAVVVSFRIQTSNPGQVHLSGPVLAQIFLGKITNWNDPQIAALNPGLGFPNEPITVVHRSDSSGTTYIFTSYLSSVSPSWASGPGTGKTVKWPVGYGEVGSSGIAQRVDHTLGAIGYFELSYAESEAIPYALIENRSGNFVAPIPANVAADALMNTNVSPSNFSIVNEQGSQSYPISGYSWLLLYERQPSMILAKALISLVDWMVHDGQKVAAETYYVPLPLAVQALATKSVAHLK